MKVLVADDEKNIRDSIVKYLAAEGFEAKAARDGGEAQQLLAGEVFDAAILDLRMPVLDGLALLAWMHEAGPSVPSIVISAYGEIKDAVSAMKLGARDYIVKPFDPEELVIRLRRLLSEAALGEQMEAGRRSSVDRSVWLGDSEAMRKVGALVEKVAATPSTVLITGESGTGKEVVARLLHELSPGRDSPFVAINLGGVPDTLLESELFGYEKGAFTGAGERKKGMLELASSGTLFLDEIGEMPIQLQVKLLRVLQEKRVLRLGGTQAIPINARVIAATNKDLEAAIKEGTFREDLFYRLNVIRIEVPPLRERREDIPRLVGSFMEKLNRQMGKKIKGVEPEALARLQAYDFPGNVRELENRLERAFIMCSSDLIETRDLGEPFLSAPKPRRVGKLHENDRELIEAALARCGGNRSRAAAELGISRRTLANKLKAYGV